MQPNGHYQEKETIRYLYHGQNEIGAVDSNDKIIELRLLGIGKGAEIGAAVALELDGKVYIPLHDHIGNVSCLLDGTTGEIAESYTYTSFGEESFTQSISPWRFASKRTDSESGFVYFGRRYYDPETGRWVTLDPIGREGGPNLYAYVLNNPLTHFDLYGLFGTDGWGSGFSSFCEGIANCIESALSFMAKIPGQALSFLSREFLPLPYVQELVDFGGWCLRGENPQQYDWQQFQSKFLYYEGNNAGNPNHLFVMANGIATSEADLTMRMAKQSEQYGGVTTYGIYDGCRGAIYDLLEAFCQKIGIPTYGQQLANNAMNWLLDQQGERQSETVIFTEAHSRGTETIYHLDRHVRERMQVTGFGPARIADRGHFLDARYYIGMLDVVPLLNPVGLYKGLKNGTVHYLPTNGNPISDHLYTNKHFEAARRNDSFTYKKTSTGAK